MTDIIRYALEIIGTIAFAISGALVAIGANLDIFGVTFIGATTAVGGGVLRDIIIGNNPPMMFLDPTFCLIAAAVSIVVFIVAYINRKHFFSIREKIEHINNFFDAMGLAAFSVTGAEIACVSGYSDNAFIVVILGTITGIGGGIFRDILTDTTPYVFKKHIYALASIFGSLTYFLLSKYLVDTVLPPIVAILLVITIRMLATKFRWSLPRIKVSRD